jgi:hypothetical protein
MKSIILISATLIFLVCCKGPQGEVGPQGVAGPIGTANVIYSEWKNTTYSGSGSSWRANIIAPKITQEILDRGLVKTYMRNIDNSVLEIPLAVNTTFLYQTLELGNIRLLSSGNYSNLPHRYIIIPGGIPLGRKANIDYSNYEAVKKAYNIPD